MSNYVISISREFGSGGRLIGKRLAAAHREVNAVD